MDSIRKKNKEKTVDQYIAACPKEVQNNLHNIRVSILKAAPKATERMDYFDIPGYSYDNGYDYDGMFVWFSYKKPFVRLHVRPPVLQDFKKDIAGYTNTKSIINFTFDKKVPLSLVKKLTKASITVMKQKKLSSRY